MGPVTRAKLPSDKGYHGVPAGRSPRSCEGAHLSFRRGEILGAAGWRLPYIELRGIMLRMAARESNPNFMNGVPELLILRLLQEQEMYGYEIVQAIRSRSQAVIKVGEGVVYPVLHGLEQEGALRSRRKTVNGRSRIYYSVTPAGAQRLVELASAWSNLATAIQKMLTGAQHGAAIS